MASIDDEWYVNKPSIKGNCADKAMNRNFFRQIDIPGSVHPTFGSSIARDAVKNLLADNPELAEELEARIKSVLQPVEI